ncbi:MAG: glycosyl hydrolase 115 family protein [Breznakibacter sp.]
MNRYHSLISLFILLVGVANTKLCAQSAKALDNHPFLLVNKNVATPILIDLADAKVVTIAANLFAGDVLNVSGQKPHVETEKPSLANQLIVAGTIGQNQWIDQLIAEKKVDASAIQGKWESWSVQVIDKPFKGIKKALVIVGSDRRATAYGILELSRMMGVSAWEWWADVHPEKRSEITLNIQNKTYQSPSVKYRGLFLNDEDWGLQPWAAKTFEPETGDIGPKTYAKVFELMLRLRANTIWPAMHNCTKPFYSFPQNKQVADDYAMVVGTSHCEPMLCNINAEWNNKTMGEWRYDNNAETIRLLFEKRTKESATFESIYTMGMRGEHDSPMNARDLTQDDRIRLLEKVITDQRDILHKETGKRADQVPQAFIPYKEVLDYYQQGLKVPDDITLMWTDDNYGYIRQLSTPDEQKRSGGAGIYYHASYWGRPHDYLWLSTTSPALIWEEMSKAFQLNARDMWILNCGDIKPLEYNIELFTDMAWDMSQFPSSQRVKTHQQSWLAAKFGNAISADLANLMQNYYQLCYQRRPEFMAWSQTEPTNKPGKTELNQRLYGDELTRRIEAWETLGAQVKQMFAAIPASQKDAFYELVYYPVTGASLMNQKWLYHYKNERAAAQGRNSAAWFAQKSADAYRQIVEETDYFNNQLCNGKWKYIMSMSPRHMPVFSQPPSSVPPTSLKTELGLALEGYDMEVNHQIENDYADVLPVFNAYLDNRFYIDLFLKGNGDLNWKAVAKDNWIKISAVEGHLSNKPGMQEQRIWVSIDRSKVPVGIDKKEAPLGHDYQLIPPSYKVNSSIDFVSGDSVVTIGISVYNPRFAELSNYQGFIEDKGYISINAENASRQQKGTQAAWQTVEGIGYTGKVVTALPYSAPANATVESILQHSPKLEYDFYTFNPGEANVVVQAVPTHPFYDGRGVRCAVAIDNADPVIIDFQTVGRSDEWKQNVLKNAAVKSGKQLISEPGKHTLTVWMVDPGVMLDQILIDLGGWKGSYAFPKETIATH